jgi:hypothetical protein
MVKKFKREVKIFVKNLSNEAKETQEAAKIVAKHIRGEKITEEEEIALKEQIFDVIKAAGIGVPFVLIPGASVLLPLIITFAKKYNIDLLPSSFSEKEEEK